MTMTPCAPWDVLWPCDIDCLSPTVTGSAVAAATEIVWAMSGRQFGLCTVTLRPCRDECYTNFPAGWSQWDSTYPQPALIGGLWFNLICGSCGNNCSCTQLSEVTLPSYVNRVIEVKVDGSPLVTGAYRVDDNRTLVRLGGSWPWCNDLNRADTQVGTWSVTAEYGVPVPDSGKWAVGELACQLAKAFNNEACALPRNVTSIVRQGVSITYADVADLFASRLTGLYLTDLFIQTFNPHGLPRRSKTYSIDKPQARRVGT